MSEQGESIPGSPRRIQDMGQSAVSALMRLSRLELLRNSTYIESRISESEQRERRQDVITGRLFAVEVLRRLKAGLPMEFTDGDGQEHNAWDLFKSIDSSIGYAEMGLTEEQAAILESKSSTEN